MAFTTGVATDMADFVAQLSAFAVANAGFHIINSAHTVLSKSGVYFHLQGDLPYLVGRLSTAYNSESYANVPGGSHSTAMSSFGVSGPFVGHYFYTDGIAVHAVLELSTNVFNHFSFGSLIKQGQSWTGGEYMSGGYYDHRNGLSYAAINDNRHCAPFTGADTGNAGLRGVLRVVGLGGTEWQRFGDEHLGTAVEGSTINGPIQTLLNNSPNRATGRTALLPQYIFTLETDDNLWFPVGYVPGVRVCRMENINPADFTNSDWQVFPVTEKNGDSLNAPNSGTYALAYQRV